MSNVMIPVWKDLEKVIDCAQGQLIICSPFYSATGLSHVLNSLKRPLAIQIFTRISPSDWASRISDPEALWQFLKDTAAKGHSSALFVNQRIHAKAYVAKGKKALVGSSNLSDGGFEQNIEMVVMLKGKYASEVADLIEKRVKPDARKISPEQLKKWINRHKKAIEDVRKAAERTQANKLREAQRNLDKILGYGRSKTKLKPVKRADLKRFIEWLKMNKRLAGAKMLISRHDNIDGQNLQGHVKQCFFSALRFTIENSKNRSSLASALNNMHSDDVYQMTEEVSNAWLKHINKHATDSGDGYDYSILRGILPPSVGGTRMGGGGGISSLKRMLPLVAQYLQEN